METMHPRLLCIPFLLGILGLAQGQFKGQGSVVTFHSQLQPVSTTFSKIVPGATFQSQLQPVSTTFSKIVPGATFQSQLQPVSTTFSKIVPVATLSAGMPPVINVADREPIEKIIAMPMTRPAAKEAIVGAVPASGLTLAKEEPWPWHGGKSGKHGHGHHFGGKKKHGKGGHHKFGGGKHKHRHH
ncbi:hypothetical protein XENTR_v10004782 [Xenopus tropicalis]|uniref:Uncharacterized protein n=1 Tax=Xenopus tropicalis TaxID=8364 RepID=A0A6I8SF58_XENTR|nr:hypothetical protein XENTR_v10004782 [Xenopus tropicalis]